MNRIFRDNYDLFNDCCAEIRSDFDFFNLTYKLILVSAWIQDEFRVIFRKYLPPVTF